MSQVTTALLTLSLFSAASAACDSKLLSTCVPPKEGATYCNGIPAYTNCAVDKAACGDAPVVDAVLKLAAEKACAKVYPPTVPQVRVDGGAVHITGMDVCMHTKDVSGCVQDFASAKQLSALQSKVSGTVDEKLREYEAAITGLTDKVNSQASTIKAHRGDSVAADGRATEELARVEGVIATTKAAIEKGMCKITSETALSLELTCGKTKRLVARFTCGDGKVDPSEDCDDGNTKSGDGCDPGCRSECGNGKKEGKEECDDGNDSNTDACTNACKKAKCGDGFTQHGTEECDAGEANANAANALCRPSCKKSFCGDGIHDTKTEECDDKNTVNTDACVASCKKATCGDSFVWKGKEVCDGSSSCDKSCKALRPGLMGIISEGAPYTIAIASSQSEDCNTACRRQGMSCNTAKLRSLAMDVAHDSNDKFGSFLKNVLKVTLHNGWDIRSAARTRGSHDSSFFGIGCPNGCWKFTQNYASNPDFRGCGTNIVNTRVGANPSCSSRGYNDGHFCGPRICTCV